MILKFFFTYIGVLLAFSVTLTVLVSSMIPGFAASGKKPIWYGLFSSLIASGAGFLSTLISDQLFAVFWFLASIYLLFGVIHVSFFQKKYFHSNSEDNFKLILGEIMYGLSIIFFSIIIFSSVQYFLVKDRDYLFYPMLMSTIAFFIPFLFLQTFEAAFTIPPAAFKTWQYPLTEQIEVPDDKPGEKLLVIGFEIAKKPTTEKRSYFRAKAPESMMLGELYYHFINDYNDAQSETTIEYADGKDIYSHTWWFRRKPKWYQKQRILDPYISVRENGIKENSVIICERIKTEK